MIRKLKAEDIDEIYKIGNNLLCNFQKTYDLNSYLNNKRYIILVLKLKEIIGFLIAYKNIDYFELQYIYINSEYRNKKMGLELYLYFEKKYLKNGDKILLEVNENNKIAQKFYDKNGYKIISKRKKYYFNEDALIMMKEVGDE